MTRSAAVVALAMPTPEMTSLIGQSSDASAARRWAISKSSAQITVIVLAAFELRLALFEKSGAPLAVVLAVERSRRGPRQCGVIPLIWILQHLVDGQPGCRNGQGRVRGDRLGEIVDVLLELIRGNDAVHQTNAQCFVGADSLARVQDHSRVGRADQ